MPDHEPEGFMRRAIALARRSVVDGGGPFGAVVVRNGTVIGEGSNRVTLANDPTAHAEIVAIRSAASALSSFTLAGCELYTSCEPCPMCLGAVWWSRIDRVWFACTREDAAAIGFDDERLYREVARPLAQRELRLTPLLREEALAAMGDWAARGDRRTY
jgi:tRNA(Arg) A34 adenosine deaminase TadA